MGRHRILKIIFILVVVLLPGYLVLRFGGHSDRIVFPGEGSAEDIAFCGEDGLQSVTPVHSEQGGYVLYLPSELKNRQVQISLPYSERLVLEDIGELKNGDILSGYTCSQPYQMTLYGPGENVIVQDELTIMQADSVPSLYISCEEKKFGDISTDKTQRLDVHYLALDTDGGVSSEGSAVMSGRGNYSFGYDQKPFNLKFSQADSVFGMSSCRKWTLLSEMAAYRAENKEQMKNKFIFDIARQMGMEYVPESTFVNLYVNGAYYGLFLMTQRPCVKGGTVNIYNLSDETEELNTTEGAIRLRTSEYERTQDGETIARAQVVRNSPDDISGGYLIEFSYYYEEDPNWFKVQCEGSDIVQPYVVVKDPEVISADEMDYIVDFTQKVMDFICADHTEEEKKHLSDYIDMDSWADIYLLEEFSAEYDLGWDSFKMYKKRGDDRLYCGPAWDFDLGFGCLAWGKYTGLCARTDWSGDDKSSILRELRQYPEFMELVREKYLNVMEPAVREYTDQILKKNMEENTSSINMNFVRWNREYPDYQEDIDTLCSWIYKRADFLEEYLTEPDAFSKVTFSFKWGDMSYYVRTGSELGYLPLPEYGEEDDAVDAFGVITGWVTENGEPVSADMLIDHDRYLAAVYDRK